MEKIIQTKKKILTKHEIFVRVKAIIEDVCNPEVPVEHHSSFYNDLNVDSMDLVLIAQYHCIYEFGIDKIDGGEGDLEKIPGTVDALVDEIYSIVNRDVNKDVTEDEIFERLKNLMESNKLTEASITLPSSFEDDLKIVPSVLLSLIKDYKEKFLMTIEGITVDNCKEVIPTVELLVGKIYEQSLNEYYE